MSTADSQASSSLRQRKGSGGKLSSMTNKLDASPATVPLEGGSSEAETPNPLQREEIVWGQTPTGEGKMPIHITFPKNF